MISFMTDDGKKTALDLQTTQSNEVFFFGLPVNKLISIFCYSSSQTLEQPNLKTVAKYVQQMFTYVTFDMWFNNLLFFEHVCNERFPIKTDPKYKNWSFLLLFFPE
jgi:hypothetical protein